MSRPLVPALALVALVVTAVTSGCAPSPSPQAPVPTSSAVEPSVDPTRTPPSPSASPSAPLDEITAIPECGALVSVDRMRTVTGDARLEGFGEDRTRTTDSLPGPVAGATYDGSGRTRTCAWGIASSPMSVMLSVAVIDAQARDTLTSALDASPEFERSRSGDVTVYTTPKEGEDRAYLAYGFDGPVWAIVDGTLVDAASSATLAAEAVSATLD
ncbi:MULTISPECIES: hypothetical protein [unclassified Microbacterium]|uniref:hypothetical protein n=1 Tax=unclassified Microbacterium TaxID=2609290 RepID=UPI003015E4FE